MEKYGACGREGHVRQEEQVVIRSTVGIGPDGKVNKHWKRVAKAEKHLEHALAVLRARS